MVLLRPALEAAVAVARSGTEADPPIAAPPGLRPFLSFRRLTSRALDRARRVLDEDEEFRARVRDAVDADAVGSAGWLFLDRPDGWEDRLAEMVGDAARGAADADSAEELARLRRELDRVRTDRDEARAELDGLRRSEVVARAEAEGARAELDAAEARVRELEREREAAREERARAVRDLKAHEERAATRLEEARRARADLAEARSRVSELESTVGAAERRSGPAAEGTSGPRDDRSSGEGAPDGPPLADPVVAGTAGVEGSAVAGPGPGVGGTDEDDRAGAGASPPLDRDALGALVARAAEAAALLSGALADAAGLVGPGSRTDGGPGAPDPVPTGDGAPGSDPAGDGGTGPADDRDARPGGRGPGSSTATATAVGRPEGPEGPGGPVAADGARVRPPAPERREPVPLPIGVFDDSPEAARHWLRSPGTTLVVDGYNVSLAGWPTLALSAQRQRLLGALEALAARTGCSVSVVFDGADVGLGLPTGSRPRGVQVRFTAPGVEADDEILAVLDALPADRPVTVASTDRRVADGARRRGASTISSAQLLAVLDA